MLRITMLSVMMVCLVSARLGAQERAPTYSAQAAAMGKLDMLVGKWKGSGWIEMGPRRFEFQSSEVFGKKAGGLAIIVEGLHWMPGPDGDKRVVHNAVAMITYDAESGRYRFISQLANGRAGDFEAILDNQGRFQWFIPDTPVGKMTYTISIDGKQYRESGEIVTPSGERKKFFEMNLTKATE